MVVPFCSNLVDSMMTLFAKIGLSNIFSTRNIVLALPKRVIDEENCPRSLQGLEVILKYLQCSWTRGLYVIQIPMVP